jgi:ubiquinone/menaquinone biosynthesis C-methylase UbiE
VTGDLAAVDAHYSRPALSTVLLDALRAGGLDPDALRPDDLAPFEEFHTGFRAETIDLAEKAGIEAGMRVLDVGCGLGGPARFLARRYGCTVTGIDASTEFVAAGTMLTDRVGQAGAVTIQRADALDLPFGDASFDVVWTQHVSMNIADKAGFYRSLHRVLRPGGRLAFHDFVAGDGRPIHLPVPWAESEDLNFLATAAQTRDLLRDAGFAVTAWADRSAEGIAFLRMAGSRPRPDGPSLGLHLYVANLREKLANMLRNLEEGRTRLVQAVAERT